MKRLLAFFAAWALIFAFVFLVCKGVATLSDNLFSGLPKDNICGNNKFIENYSIKNKNNKKKMLKLSEKTMNDCRASVKDTSLFYDEKNTIEDPCAMSLIQLGMSTLYYLDVQKVKDVPENKDIARRELSGTLEYFKKANACEIKQKDMLPEVVIVRKSLEYALERVNR